ncbi:MAG: NifU family protein [Planctomycetes bacterium]|nr:NifU family protein [Planctomycetota bacterium]
MASNDSSSTSAIFKEVYEVVELIRPSIQADGGDLELVSVNTKGVVSIRFLGACIGCPSLDMTLQSTIETTLKNRIDAVTSVEAVE